MIKANTVVVSTTAQLLVGPVDADVEVLLTAAGYSIGPNSSITTGFNGNAFDLSNFSLNPETLITVRLSSGESLYAISSSSVAVSYMVQLAS